VAKKDPWYAKQKPGDMVPLVDGPENIITFVSGGAGAHSAYFSGFGRPVVTKAVGK